MSYPIIFETKIIKLSDGRIIHFDRSGCNNDTAGRKKDEFRADIYTMDEFMNKIEKLKKNSKPIKESDPHDWELKIGSRYATLYDYGEHLLRMFKRAFSYKELINSKRFVVKHITGIELIEPEYKIMSLEEFDKIYFDLLYGGKGLTYRRMIDYPNVLNESKIVDLIDKKQHLEFEIS